MPRTNVDRIGSEYRRTSDFIRGEMRRKKVSQSALADYIGCDQSGLSKRLSGQVEWSYREILGAFELLESSLTEVI